MVQVLGAAVRPILDSLLNVEMSLKDFPKYEEVKKMELDKYYPMELFTELVDYLEKKYSKAVMLKLGKAIGDLLIEYTFKPMKITEIHSAFEAISQSHAQFCKPIVGHVKVIEKTENSLKVDYTAPYNKTLQEGLYLKVAEHFGGKFATVKRKDFPEKGDTACLYDVSWR